MRAALPALALLAAAFNAHAQEASAPAAVSEVVVTADPAGLLERRPSGAVTGLPIPLLETPRSATFVGAVTLERYGVRTVDDLIAVSPGAFTDSYYGVPGALNLRGTLAETYFAGFKRIENRGTYPTPLGAAERVEILRGPPMPLYGPGKVGGLLNIIPKTARDPERGLPEATTGAVEAGAGDYGYGLLTGEISAPVKLGALPAGLYAYAEAETGPEYYRGIRPEHAVAQGALDIDLAPGWRANVTLQIERSTGAVQTPGWNRLTQALVDRGQYLTGRDTTLKDADGNGRLTPNEVGAGGLLTGYFGFKPAPDPRFTLDTGVGTATLDRRTVFVSARDFNDTDTHTATASLTRTLANGDAIELEGFYDDQSNTRFVSYGFPADYQAGVGEARLTWLGLRHIGPVKLDLLAGADVRRYSGRQKESFNGGNLALDRRDLIAGPTATDILDDPFSAEPGGVGLTWETDVVSRYTDAGLFGQARAVWGRFDLLAGLRGDRFELASRDDGTLVFGAARGRTYTADDDAWSGNLALSVDLPLGLRPYVSLARSQALELGQAGGVAPQLILGGSELSKSYLAEAGMKWRWFGDRVTGSAALYRQTRTRLSLNNSVSGVRGEGGELELRWLATHALSFTFAGDLQRSTIRGPDGSFVVIPPAAVGVAPQDGYGGGYALYALSGLVPGDYTNTHIPRYVASLFATWSGDRHPWGRVGATLGATAVGHTQGVLPVAAVRLPAYAVWEGSAFYERGPWRVTVNVDNLFDRLYFTPIADVYAEVAALPSEGRTWRVRLRRSF